VHVWRLRRSCTVGASWLRNPARSSLADSGRLRGCSVDLNCGSGFLCLRFCDRYSSRSPSLDILSRVRVVFSVAASPSLVAFEYLQLYFCRNSASSLRCLAQETLVVYNGWARRRQHHHHRLRPALPVSVHALLLAVCNSAVILVVSRACARFRA
jgi:hypothetical protein